MLVSAQEWTQNNENNVKKLSDTALYIQLTFKGYAAHSMQDAFCLQKATAATKGLSKVKWKCTEVKRLLENFMFLSADTQVVKQPVFFPSLITDHLLAPFGPEL